METVGHRGFYASGDHSLTDRDDNIALIDPDGVMDAPLDADGIEKLVKQISYPESTVVLKTDWSKVVHGPGVEPGVQEERYTLSWTFRVQREEEDKVRIVVVVAQTLISSGFTAFYRGALVTNPSTEQITPKMILREVFKCVSVLEYYQRQAHFQYGNLPLFVTFNQSWTPEPDNQDRWQQPIPDFHPYFVKYYDKEQRVG